MWFDFGIANVDMRKVSTVTLLQDDEEKLLITMDSGQQIVATIENASPSETYKSICSLLETLRDRDDRIVTNSFELLKRIHSEMELISKELKLLSENLRRL